MKLTKVLSVATMVALCALNVNASEFSFFGGMQKTKSLSSNNGGKSVGSYELNLKMNPEQSGFASNLKMKYQDNKGLKFYDLEYVVGWQFGDKSKAGAFRLLPVGFGYRYMKFDTIYGVYGTHHTFNSTGSWYYKAGLEYQKDALLIDNLSLNAGIYYQKALYTGTWANDDGTYNLGYGSSHELKYKPSGLEFEVGLDYDITKNFAVGVKAGYSKISDKAFVDGTKIYINDGFNLSAGLKYKF